MGAFPCKKQAKPKGFPFKAESSAFDMASFRCEKVIKKKEKRTNCVSDYVENRFQRKAEGRNGGKQKMFSTKLIFYNAQTCA